MSFNIEVKNEIISNSFSEKDHMEYVLIGILCVNLRINEEKIELITKNVVIIDYIEQLCNELYNCNLKALDFDEIKKFFRNYEEQQYMIPNIKLSNSFLLRCFIIGVYLGSGSITEPTTSYHVEMKTGSEKLSYFVINLLDKFDVCAKISLRNGNFYIYINDAEGISDLLKICGSIHALLKFEDQRVVKDVRNAINRKVNCELANLNKIIETGLKQQEDILLIKNNMGLSNLPKKLYDVAIIRLEDEQLSFIEIGDMLSPKISKSTVCKRLKKIGDIAEELRGD